ncbi:marine proteobacterial sortase target protein [Sessilibacter corallicola]|uniref:marine proteobacterial sortase target protein n=1 Tax=Sessilibacter corallicola TaxID=2904075 RepID=UPI001E3EC8F1|nr:marine proteobacterial sortase target protein [Sessilibacter corallicola]MCE2030314.1 marine proteobacterial sortase target protein [Sessilibacter corallicola]
MRTTLKWIHVFIQLISRNSNVRPSNYTYIHYQQPLGYKPKKIPKERLLDSRPRKKRFEYAIVSAFIIALIALLLVLAPKIANASAFEQSTGSGDLLFNGAGKNNQPALHLKSEVSVDISGMIATTRLQQTFKNPTNDWLEGTYVFPLPDNASVTDMTIIISDRKIKAEIKEKHIAKEIYLQAKSEGKKAALVEQKRANVFKQHIANISPQEEITVELTFYQTVKYDNGYFEYRLPTTMTPRYTPKDNTHSRQKNQNLENPETQSTAIHLGTQGWNNDLSAIPFIQSHKPSESDRSSEVDNPIKIEIQLDPGLELADITGLYHDIKAERKNGSYQISTDKTWQSMNRDFVITWLPATGSKPEVALFKESIAGENYGLIVLLPPTEQTTDVNRSVTFIIDTSGSMGGTSINQAKSALMLALKRLSPKDTFNVIEFNSNTRSLFSSPRYAESGNLNSAFTFVNSLRAGGGTEMKPALNAALQSNSHDENLLEQIVFITDGSVTNEQDLLQLIHNKLGNKRLFTVSIGSAPNSYFMNKASQFGRGTSVHIGDIAEVHNKMQDLFVKLENATLQSITVDWPNHIDAWPKKIGDLYRNEPLVIAYKENTAVQSDITSNIHGFFGDGTLWQQTLTISNASTSKNNKGISKIWARKKIDALMDKIISGEPEDSIKPQVVEIALQHSLLSKYTSLVAVEEEISRPLGESTAHANVPLVSPLGQTLITTPQTDTPKTLHLILSILLFVFGLMFHRLHRGAHNV